MKCLKCGAYVYSSDKFCRSCGTTLTNENCQYGDNISNSKYDSSSCHGKQYDYSTAYSSTKKDSDTKYTSSYDYEDKYTFDYSKFDYAKPNDSGGDDKYIKAYVGENYSKIKKQKFSFPALIFGPWYLLYRKVWGYAIALLIISIAAVILLNDYADIVNTIISIFVAFKFNSIYMKQAENHVESIKQQNLDKSTLELLEVCKKKGGTSKKGIIITIVGLIILTVFAFFTIFDPDEVAEILDLDDNTEEVEVQNNDEFENIEDEKFTYTVPTGFEKKYGSSFYKRFEYKPSNSIICNLTIDKTTLLRNYPDEKTYLEKKMNTVGTSSYQLSSVTPININGKEWKYMQLETPQRRETLYAFKTNEEIYVIKTYDYKYNNQSNTACDTKYNEFINSVKIK